MGPRHVSEVELTEYADGELAAERVTAVEAHLRHCQVCAASVAGTRTVSKASARVADRRAPSGIRERAAAVLTDPALRVSCKQASAMMHERLDLRLSLVAAVPLGLHLDACQRCREELAALSSATRAVRTLPNLEAPARVREHVRAAYHQRTRRAFGTPRWRPAVAAAFAVLIIGAVSLMRPAVNPTSHQAVKQTAELPTRPPSNPIEVAAVTVAPVAGAEQPAPSGPRPAVAEVARPASPARVARAMTRPTVAMFKGPAPAVTTVAAEPPRVALPAAFRALRTVAQRASSDWGVQRAMEMAGEPFQTLDSEAAAERRVAALPAGSAGDISGAGRDARREEPKPVSGGGASPAEDGGGGQSKQPSAPVREGALSVGPFV